ncbi:EpsG family protein [Flavobacterium weaverense]|uniref:EpsG-like putative glucosyltransferase n=1 Tax=Flavobacterium weaverense TaxID=271156 RepID=A0A3L9ZRD6_9FLAO|nr:EpsG family protein [Flavobacterium weaverense]RMA74837.1 EpsG-like putative glucosyltransferase [Flavobacterium weaverense]
MWVYFLLFFLILFFGAFYKYKLTKSSVWFFWILGFILFFITAFRAEGVDNDYVTYLMAITENWGIREPAFTFISYLSYNLLGSTKLVFVIFAALIIPLLFFGLKGIARFFYLSLLIYYSFYFSVYGFNAIRAGVGIGLFFFALKYWIQRKKKVVFFFLTLASLFHFSFVIFFPLYFLVKDDSKHLKIFIGLIPIAYLAYFVKLDVLSLLLMIPFPQLQQLVILYDEVGKDVVANANVFGFLILIRLLILFWLVIYREFLASRFDGFYIYLKLYSIGFFFFIFFSGFKSGAFRTAELFWVNECLLLPMFVVLFNPRWFGTLILILLCVCMMFFTYILSDFLRPFNFNFDL